MNRIQEKSQHKNRW